jgi:hypothetical protein
MHGSMAARWHGSMECTAAWQDWQDSHAWQHGGTAARWHGSMECTAAWQRGRTVMHGSMTAWQHSSMAELACIALIRDGIRGGLVEQRQAPQSSPPVPWKHALGAVSRVVPPPRHLLRVVHVRCVRGWAPLRGAPRRLAGRPHGRLAGKRGTCWWPNPQQHHRLPAVTWCCQEGGSSLEARLLDGDQRTGGTTTRLPGAAAASQAWCGHGAAAFTRLLCFAGWLGVRPMVLSPRAGRGGPVTVPRSCNASEWGFVAVACEHLRISLYSGCNWWGTDGSRVRGWLGTYG